MTGSMYNEIRKSVDLINSCGYRWDAIKMSAGAYSKLLEERNPIIIYRNPETDLPEKETFMGLEIFVDYKTPVDYYILGPSELFKLNAKHYFIDNSQTLQST